MPWRTIWKHEYPGGNKKKIWLKIFETPEGELKNATIMTKVEKGRTRREYIDEIPIGVEGLRNLKKELNHTDLRPLKPDSDFEYECLMCDPPTSFNTKTGPDHLHMTTKHGRNLGWALEVGKARRVNKSK